LEDLGVDERILLKMDLKEKELDCVDWIPLAEVRDQ
jgi:hypothetical protein